MDDSSVLTRNIDLLDATNLQRQSIDTNDPGVRTCIDNISIQCFAQSSAATVLQTTTCSQVKVVRHGQPILPPDPTASSGVTP